MTKIVILQSNYAPWPGYFELILNADKFVFYDTAKYTKNDWRNRNIIIYNNKKKWLTIPVSSDAVKKKINQVTPISDLWRETHSRILREAYQKAPYLNQLKEMIDNTILLSQNLTLSEINKKIIHYILKKIKCTTTIIDSKMLVLPVERVDRLIEICKKLDADQYITGPAGFNYLEKSKNKFDNANIKIKYFQYGKRKTYNNGNNDGSCSIYDLVAHIPYENMTDYIHKLS